MPLELHEITSADDFNDLVQCECDSYRTPLNTFFHLFRHDWSPKGFIELRDRQIKEWKSDPTARWFKVVDTELGGKLIGGAKWNTFEKAPYTERERAGHPAEATWWPEGE